MTKLKIAYAELNQMASNITAGSDCFGKKLECTKLLDIESNADLAKTFVELAQLKNITIKRNTKWIDKFSDGSYSPLDYIIKTNKYQLGVLKPDIGFVDKCNANIPIYHNYLRIIVIPDLNAKEYILGKNTFLLILNRDFRIVTPSYNTAYSKFCPSETAQASEINSNCTSGKGYSCYAKIIQDGWKITY